MARTSALPRPALAAVPERAAATPTELLQRMGWLADLGASLAGSEPVPGDVTWWLLSPDSRAAVLANGADRA